MLQMLHQILWCTKIRLNTMLQMLHQILWHTKIRLNTVLQMLHRNMAAHYNSIKYSITNVTSKCSDALKLG
jgi:hypothetical protein